MSSGSIEAISPSLIAAARERAEYVAEMVGNELRPSGKNQAGPELILTRSLLLELGAALQLRCWEAAGIVDHLNYGLPEFSEAIQQIAQGFERSTGGGNKQDSDLLSFRVMKYSLERMAWSGQSTYSSDLVVGEVSEEMLDELAQTLWANRNELQKLLEDSEDG
ncbi:hypothetical protein [Rubinisphaera brasiliensis]|uniref:Uncharacterized protein n=1 Tax=Rubinisphaera brasiliensis (strain ATCC 49424 / DSM 5305 / JCM 21570 / IAM 15109 / NBRC 103401 / IFAM 1448) TaxID=756272 RepID=F0SQC6_RUBBR|nr:hypothetical protein [Rubinisphaera brasiliensis]ADY62305.1 hypothetical protein Plabr_4734 [Rubinisphaera brasiliensis DSM 5305]